MEHSPQFAVLVPYYAGLEHLGVALRSVLAQTDASWWCTVVDDSPDAVGVAALVEGFGDERVSYVRNPSTLGVAGNFNRCFELAAERRAELVTILHADDELEPGYVQSMRAAHAGHPEAACVAPRVTVIDAAGRPARTLPDTVKRWLWPRRLDRLEGERGLQLLLRGQFFYCPSVSYRLDRLTLPAWSPRWSQVMDLELYARLLLGGGTIVLEPRSLFRYRRHAGTATEANSASLVRTAEETALCGELAREAAGRGWRAAARAGRWRVTVRLQALVRLAGLVARRRWRDAARAGRFAVAR